MEYVKLLACHVDKLTSGSLLLRKKQKQKHSSLPLKILNEFVGTWAAGGADAGAEKDRGVSERCPSLRETSQRADLPGLVAMMSLPFDHVFLQFFYLKFSFITSNPTVCGGQKDAAADAGAHRETPDQSQELQETSRNGCKSRFNPSV